MSNLTTFALCTSSTTADIAETYSAPSVQRRTPSRHPLKSQCGSARRASRSSKADFPLSSLYLPLNTPLPYPLPLFLLQQAEEGVSLSYFNVHYRGQTLCEDSHLHVTPGSAAEGNNGRVLMKRHQSHVTGMWWDWLGLSVSVFVPLLLLWTARERRQWELNTILSSFEFVFTSPSLFGVVSSFKLVALYAVKCLASGGVRSVRHWKSDWGGKYCISDVENHCCPTKVNASNYFVHVTHFLCVTSSIWSLIEKFKSVITKIFWDILLPV